MLKKNGFILALLAAVALAFTFPQLGASDGVLRAGLISKAGVMVIFFLQGLSLKTRELIGGLAQFRLHGFIQAWIFLFAAVILLGVALLLRALGQAGLADGFLYLLLVPTTISSAVAFTGTAGGNVPAAIFNTTFSNVLGVFWVPLGCVLIFASGGSLQADLILPMLAKVAQLILLPLLLGQVLRPPALKSGLLQKVSPGFKPVNHGIILFIVFAALSQSFLSGAWKGVGPLAIGLLIGLTTAAVLIIHAGAWITSKGFARNRADRITALFCGSQKTLAAGVPMAVAIFSGGNELAGINLGLLILPLLCYHPIQLFLGALLLPKLGN